MLAVLVATGGRGICPTGEKKIVENVRGSVVVRSIVVVAVDVDILSVFLGNEIPDNRASYVTCGTAIFRLIVRSGFDAV